MTVEVQRTWVRGLAATTANDEDVVAGNQPKGMAAGPARENEGPAVVSVRLTMQARQI